LRLAPGNVPSHRLVGRRTRRCNKSLRGLQVNANPLGIRTAKRTRLDQHDEPQYDAFISYSHADEEFVWRLARHLTNAGLQVFFDQAELAVGDSLVSKITEAVRTARFLGHGRDGPSL